MIIAIVRIARAGRRIREPENPEELMPLRRLLRNLPYTIDYTSNDRFGVLDQRKLAGQNEVFVSRPTGNPAPTVLYGLLSSLTSTDADRSPQPQRTLVVSGPGSAGVQARWSFLLAAQMRNMKERFLTSGLKGFRRFTRW